MSQPSEVVIRTILIWDLVGLPSSLNSFFIGFSVCSCSFFIRTLESDCLVLTHNKEKLKHKDPEKKLTFIIFTGVELIYKTSGELAILDVNSSNKWPVVHSVRSH